MVSHRDFAGKVPVVLPVEGDDAVHFGSNFIEDDLREGGREGGRKGGREGGRK